MKSEILSVELNQEGEVLGIIDSIGGIITNHIVVRDRLFLTTSLEMPVSSYPNLVAINSLRVVKVIGERVKSFKCTSGCFEEIDVVSSGVFAVSMMLCNSKAPFIEDLAKTGVVFLGRSFRISDSEAKEVQNWLLKLEA